MRSAYCTELFCRATTLPVKTTSPSLPQRSILSASTGTGCERSSLLCVLRVLAGPAIAVPALGGGPLGVGVPADDAGVHTQPVAGSNHDVLANLHVLGLLIEFTLVAQDGPGAIFLEHAHG